MGQFCDCPVGAEISNLTINACPENIGQIQKILFQRTFSTGSTLNKLVIATANPNVLASWTPLLAASDGTKVVQTPFVSEPVSEAGAKREFGGGNATIGGIPINIGREPAKFSAKFLASKQDVIKELKTYQCELVGVYYVDEFGNIIGLTDDIAAPVDFFGIPVRGVFVGDKTLGGLENPDDNMLEFYHLPNWSDNLHIVTPTDFNALTDLVTP